MIRRALTLSVAFLVFWGCASLGDKSMEATKAASVDQEKAELIRQLEEAKAAFAAKERERADLARQLQAMKSALAGSGERDELARQVAAAKEQEKAELARQRDAAKAALATSEAARAAKATTVAKEGEKVTAAELAKTLSEKKVVTLRNILFDKGKAAVKPESEKQLAEVGQLLKNDQTLKLEIQGHTDNVGTRAFNRRLSQARAAAVKDYIVNKYGIAADRLTAAGFGFDKPVAKNATAEGRALNRRVELVTQ